MTEACGGGGGQREVEAGETFLQIADRFGPSRPRALRKPWDFRGVHDIISHAHFSIICTLSIEHSRFLGFPKSNPENSSYSPSPDP